MSAPTPNPRGHRPYTSRPPNIPLQPINASVGQAAVARKYGYTGTIDHGNGDGTLRAQNAQGVWVTSDKNGKFPEQVEEERRQADARVQEQQAQQERRDTLARTNGVVPSTAQWDDHGNITGGVHAGDGSKISRVNGKLVSDGRPNPQLLQKLAQGASSPTPSTPAAAAPKVDPQHSPAQSILDVAAANKQDGPLGQGYGTARIIHEAKPPTIPSADDPQRTTANRIDVAGGGSVTVPAYNGGGAPDGGVYVNGKAMAHGANGALVADLSRASGAPPTVPTSATPTSQFAAGFKGVPAQTQAMLAQMYPGLAQAGSEQHKQFMDALARTGSDGSDALSIAHTLFAPQMPTTPPSDPAAAKQADEANVAATQPGRNAVAVAGQVQSQAQGQVRQAQATQTARIAAPSAGAVTQAREQTAVEQNTGNLGDYSNPNDALYPVGAKGLAGTLPTTTPTTSSGAAGVASLGSADASAAARTAAASPLKFPDAPKIGEMPKPLTPPASTAPAGISGFGDNAAGGSKPPGIPGPDFDKSASAAPVAGATPPQVPTVQKIDEDESKKLASAATL